MADRAFVCQCGGGYTLIGAIMPSKHQYCLPLVPVPTGEKLIDIDVLNVSLLFVRADRCKGGPG